MATETPNIKLKLIEDTDLVNQDLINANSLRLENELTTVRTNIATLNDNVGKVGSKKVDEASRVNGASLVWDTALDQYKHTVITGGGGGASSAADVSNTPAGNISSENVQDAIYELDTKKASVDSPSLTGTPTINGKAIVATDDSRLTDERVPVDDSVTDAKIGNRTAADATPPTSLTSTLLGHLTNIYSMFKLITGKSTGILPPSASLETLWTQADIGTLFISAGSTFSPITRAGRNKTYNKIFVDCHGETPTSLVLTIYHDGALLYTSPAIIQDETSLNVALSITGEQKVQAFVSNTTGLTKGISVSIMQVNR
ncbi:hypothetical protein [Pelosinus fermentans]|uniref:Uncharacterized protein n=1 Tax=Pelosinus fermentans JBW45 TaxID=1192197 RepID=I9DCI4_9FIRM|nr:hypothetical protein [Pelosinus fermentans]AJQ26931.1 hypothetical protein JBW_01581 [Pelosinus fermentans JBW45]